MSTPKHTPTKAYPVSTVNLKEICRLCGINFKIAGRGHYNIFSAFKHDLQRRLSRLLKRDVVQENHLSSVVCQGCFRKIRKVSERAG